MKLLFVTCRKIDQKGGENALVMGRHLALYHQFGIETDIIFFHKDNEAESAPYPGIRFLSGNKATIYQRMEELLDTNEYSGIVCSGFYSKKFNDFVLNQKEKHNLVYITDIHATIREIYEYCIPDLYHILGTRYLYMKKRFNFIDTIKKADYAFVVSDEEIAEVNRYCPNNKIKFIKIRCGCYTQMDVSQYFANRSEARKNFGLDDDTLAFVYSGSKDRWQKYEETIALFERIQKSGGKCKFAMYMKLDDAEKKKLEERLGSDNVIVRWVNPEQMKKELTAFDCGVILRDEKWTNRVAFPNKFSDYIAGGLNMVLSPALIDPYKLAQKYSLTLFDPTDIANSVRILRETRTHGLSDYIETCKKMIEKELFYDMQVKDEAGMLYMALKNR